MRAIVKNAIERPNTILPINFFTFFVRPWSVTYGTFVNSAPDLRYLRGHFWFESEPVFTEIDALDDLPFEEFIACLHVRDVEIGEHVRDGCQRLVHPRVPEIEDATTVRLQI